MILQESDYYSSKKNEFINMLNKLGLGTYFMATEHKRAVARWARKDFPELLPKSIRVLVACNEGLERTVKELSINLGAASQKVKVLEKTEEKLKKTEEKLNEYLNECYEYTEKNNKLMAQDKIQKDRIKTLESTLDDKNIKINIQEKEINIQDIELDRIVSLPWWKRFFFTGIK